MTGLHLDTDPFSGAVETFEYDHTSDTAIIRRVADVQPVIDRNKERLNHDVHRKTPGDLDMRHVAAVPIEVSYLWLQKYGICAWKKEHWPAVKKMLNSNEWRYLRTSELYL